MPTEPHDLTVDIGDGIVNIRVGAVILRDGHVLMAGNRGQDYLYSVGGRIKFGECAEDAVRREVLEEVGVPMEIDRLGFVHENFFYGDLPKNRGRLIYEISFFFYMKIPENFRVSEELFRENVHGEFLVWEPLDGNRLIYPDFFRTALSSPTESVLHFVTDDRKHPA